MKIFLAIILGGLIGSVLTFAIQNYYTSAFLQNMLELDVAGDIRSYINLSKIVRDEECEKTISSLDNFIELSLISMQQYFKNPNSEDIDQIMYELSDYYQRYDLKPPENFPIDLYRN